MSAFAVHAQSIYTSSLSDGNLFLRHPGNGSIVRSWSSTYILSCHKDNGAPVFCLTKAGNFHGPYNSGGLNYPAMYTTRLPLAMNVTDISIVEDYAFFCGNYVDSNNVSHGLIGRFDLNQFFSSGSPFMVEYYTTTAVTHFKKVLAIRPVGTSWFVYDVMAVGEDATYNNLNKLMMIVMPFSLTPTVYCLDFDHNSSYTQLEIIDDIVYDLTKVYFVGRSNVFPLSNTLITRTVNMQPFNSFPNPINVRYSYPNPSNEINGHVCAKILYSGHEKIAVAYTHILDNGQSVTRVRVINQVNHNTWRSHQFEIEGKEEVQDMVHSHSTERLALLQLTKTIYGTNPQILYLDILNDSSIFVPRTAIYSGHDFTSIDIFRNTDNTDKNIVTVGGNVWHLQNIPGINPDSAPCPDVDEIPFTRIDELTHVADTISLFGPYIPSYSCDTLYLRVNTSKHNVNCFYAE